MWTRWREERREKALQRERAAQVKPLTELQEVWYQTRNEKQENKDGKQWPSREKRVTGGLRAEQRPKTMHSGAATFSALCNSAVGSDTRGCTLQPWPRNGTQQKQSGLKAQVRERDTWSKTGCRPGGEEEEARQMLIHRRNIGNRSPWYWRTENVGKKAIGICRFLKQAVPDDENT